MKKLFFSAVALIAFSATSFASGNLESTTTLDSKIVNELSTQVAAQVLNDDSCFTFEVRWTETTVTNDGPSGYNVSIVRHKVTVEICDDGTVTIN